MSAKIVLVQGTFDYRNLAKVRWFETEYVVQENGDNPVGRSPQQFRIIAELIPEAGVMPDCIYRFCIPSGCPAQSILGIIGGI